MRVQQRGQQDQRRLSRHVLAPCLTDLEPESLLTDGRHHVYFKRDHMVYPTMSYLFKMWDMRRCRGAIMLRQPANGDQLKCPTMPHFGVHMGRLFVSRVFRYLH